MKQKFTSFALEREKVNRQNKLHVWHKKRLRQNNTHTHTHTHIYIYIDR